MVGKVLAHYEILKLLGRGGMGDVYLAEDVRLARPVALKVLSPALAEEPEYLKRFEREARAAAAINHPNIVTLYSVEEAGGVRFLTMELVEGDTLGSFVSAGGLPAGRFYELAVPLASALAEAHDKGVVHRDLKPGNVMVTDDGRVKVLDFGLAKLRARPRYELDADATTRTDEPSRWPTLTADGQVLGTLPYMSPEQVQGRRVDHRSDVFSLAVVFYELATGERPFQGDSAAELTAAILRDRPAMVSDLKPEYPQSLGHLVQRCLEKDPARRYSSARDVHCELEAAKSALASAGISPYRASGDHKVAQKLGRLSGQLSSGDVDRPELTSISTTSPAEIFTPSAVPVDLLGRRRWLMTIAALLVVGVAATYLLTRSWSGGPQDIPVERTAGQSIVEERPRAVLADFQNHTGEAVLDDSIELAFRVSLERSRFASFLPASRIQAALSRMQRDPSTIVDRELGVEIGQREHARALVVGSIGKIGNTYSLSAEIIDPRDGTSTFSTTTSAADSDALFAALEAITKEIRLNLGESLAAIEETKRPLEKVTTKDLEALKAYSVGVRKIAEGQNEAAIQFLERAIEIDPEFAMAYAKLATVFIYLDLDNDKILEALDNALRLSDRLTELEKLYVEGWAARLHGEPEGVLRIWTLMSSLYPEEYMGHYNLGVAHQVYFENYEAATRAYEAAAGVAKPESLSLTLVQLGYCQIALEHYDAALSTLERTSGEARPLALSALHLATRSYPEVQDALATVTGSRSRALQIQGRLRLAQLHADLGRFESALREARLAAELASKEGLERLDLVTGLAISVLQRQLAADAEFRRSLIAAVEAGNKLMSIEPGKVDLSPVKELALVGKLAARSGEVEIATAIHALIAPLIDETPITAWHGYSLMLRGEISVARGEHAAALQLFKDAIARIDSFQVHESLANSYDVQGVSEAAIAEYEWLTRHRGRAVVECLERCPSINVIHWSSAFHRLGLLHEKNGDRQKAADYYRRVLAQWSEAEEHAARRDAAKRLEGLESPASEP